MWVLLCRNVLVKPTTTSKLKIVRRVRPKTTLSSRTLNCFDGVTDRFEPYSCKKREGRGHPLWQNQTPGPPGRIFSLCLALLLPIAAGPQRSTGLVGADDDARGRNLRADQREFPWRGSFRKDAFASA